MPVDVSIVIVSFNTKEILLNCTSSFMSLIKQSSMILLSMLSLTHLWASSLSAVDYYLSTSGDDSKPGRSPSDAWRSLSKIDSLTLAPADRILLKRGDVWINEFIQINGQGGNSTARCVLTAYGSGVPPKIQGSSSSAQQFFNCITLANAGYWEISYIDFDHARRGLYLYIDDAVSREDIWIHDINCTNMSYFSQTDYDDMGTGIDVDAEPGSSLYNGISYSNVTIEDINTDNVFRSTRIIAVNNLTMRRVKGINGGVGGINAVWCNGLIEYCTAVNCGGVRSGGTTGGYLYGTRNGHLTIEHCEFAHTYRGNTDTPDGCGLDFEGANQNVTINSCLFHDNDGTGIMLFDTGAVCPACPPNGNSGIEIQNSVFYRNALDPYFGNAPCGHIIEQISSGGNHTGTLQGNRFYVNSFCPVFGKGDFTPRDWSISNNQEMNIHTARDGTNLALSMVQSVTVSSGTNPTGVKDGNESSYWQAGGMNDQWIEFDFGSSPPTINQFIIKQHTDYVVRFVIQYRDSTAERWVDCWNGTNMAPAHYCPTWNMTARYVRLFIYTSSLSNPQISEIEMYYDSSAF
jgi:hypothetical protein